LFQKIDSIFSENEINIILVFTIITMSRTMKDTKTNRLKRNKDDSSSDSEDIWETETEISSDDESDTESDSETESESEQEIKKKSNKRKNRRRVVSSDEEEDDDDDDDDDYEEYDEDEGDEKLNKKDYRKFLYELFPSRYSKEKAGLSSKSSQRKKKYIKADSSDSEEEEVVRERKVKKKLKNKKKKTKSKSKKVIEESESSEYEEEDADESEEESSQEETSDSEEVSRDRKKKSKKRQDGDDNQLSIVLSLENESGILEDIDFEDDEDDEDEDEECDTDDEETFMKGQYEKIEDSVSKKKTKKNKVKETSDEECIINPNVETEYTELLSMKKDLIKKLHKNPKSKFLLNALKNCKKEIGHLIKDSRKNNTKEFRKLVLGDSRSKMSEINYFKKKLSNSEQMKIMKDLKEINKNIKTDKPYRLLLLESPIPPMLKSQAMEKLNVLKTMEPGESEYYKIKHWIDTFMKIPFCKYNNLDVNISNGIDACHSFMVNAKQTLDDCVYGLDDAKLQIMQMIGQWITNPNAMGTAIAIKGPPGTGKTTLVKEGISKILGREFSFIPLGGTGDASFLEGHSYTYEGSSHGKIVQILINSKCMNPVIYFDELDKISDTAKGEEITGVLTHLTDSTQNSQFNDKYFSDVDFDLSKCLFIFSYNDESRVNPILKDRMYRIQTKGYDAKEKLVIARKYMLPKIREQVNFTEEDVVISDDVIQYIISNDTWTQQEQGVRNMKRCLEIIHTKLNLYRLVKPGEDNIFAKDIGFEVSFPFTVERKHVDKLIKNEEKQSQSLLAMYI
jgi:ATP-dependent Lon protease